MSHISLILKPQKRSYFFSVIFGEIILLAISFGVWFFLPRDVIPIEMPSWVIPMSLLGLIIFYNLWFIIAFKKEKYEFSDTSIYIHRGNIFTSSTVEIPFSKITLIKAELEFLSHLLFKTGNISISTGGMGGEELYDLDVPLDIFEKIQESMRENGFRLRQNELVQDAKPHKLAVLGEVFTLMVSVFFVCIYIVTNILPKEKNLDDLIDILSQHMLWVYVGCGVLGLIFLAFIVIQFLDLRRRKYRIFTDAIVYYEGFLTKNFAIIPMEKVADVSNTQSFFSKIFGLHDIIVSPSGSENMVKFHNMEQGELMIKNINYLKNAISLPMSENVQELDIDAGDAFEKYTNRVDEIAHYNKDFTAEFSPHPWRLMFGTICMLFISIPILWFVFFFLQNEDMVSMGFMISLLIVFLPIIQAAIQNIISIKFLKFSVTSSTLEGRFSFLSNKHIVFTVDKVTRVDFTQNPIDKIFGTTTIWFTSVGSSIPLVFKHIKYTPDLKQNILQKVGVYESDIPNHVIDTDFSFLNMIRANIWQIIIFPLLPFIWLYKKLVYSPRFYANAIFNNFIRSRRLYPLMGFTWYESYVLFENVKGIHSTKYLGTQTGDLVLSISGSLGVNQTNEKPRWLHFGNTINMQYISQSRELVDHFDEKLNNNALSSEIIFEETKSIKNMSIGYLIELLLFAGVVYGVRFLEGVDMDVFVVGATIFAIISLILFLFFVISTKMTKYVLYEDRVIKKYGIIYKSQQSILFSKVNFINKEQNLIAKICNNGRVNIYTLGAGTIDLSLEHMPRYEDFYNELKQRTEKKI